MSKSNRTIKLLPGYGNASLKRKEIKPYVAKDNDNIFSKIKFY